MPESHIRIGEAAAILGITEDHLRDLCNDEKIPCTRTPGGHRLFNPELLAHIKEHGLGEWVTDYEESRRALGRAERYDPKKGKQVDVDITAPFFVADNGSSVMADIGTVGIDSKRHQQPRRIGDFTLRTDSATFACVKGITLVVDPLIIQDGWSNAKAVEAKASYAAMLSALLAGSVTIDALPFPKRLTMPKLRVIQAAYPAGPDVVAPGIDIGSAEAHPDVEMHLPVSSSWGVYFRVPSRAVLDQGEQETDAAGHPVQKPSIEYGDESGKYRHCLTGLILVELRCTTLLGNVTDFEREQLSA